MNTLLLPDQIIALANEHYDLANIESCTFFNRGFNDHYLIATKQDKFVFVSILITNIILNRMMHTNSNWI